MMGTFRQFHKNPPQKMPNKFRSGTTKNLTLVKYLLVLSGIYSGSLWERLASYGPPHWREGGFWRSWRDMRFVPSAKKCLHKKMPSKNSSNLPVENFSRVRKIALPLEYRTNSWPILTTFSFGCLRSKVLSVRIDWYCWWKKSCTTWNV